MSNFEGVIDIAYEKWPFVLIVTAEIKLTKNLQKNGNAKST